MNAIFTLFNEIPFTFISLLLLVNSLFLYFIFYIYININIKSISNIVFGRDDYYKRPLEPFNFLFISILPTTFIREILHIKYGCNFKNLYKNDFYYEINNEKLEKLLENYKLFFIFQYVICFSTTLFFVFIWYAHLFAKEF